MTILSEFQNDFNSLLEFGEHVRFKYYNQFFVNEYDDDVSLAQSGTDFWVSGIVQPISNNQFNSEALLLEQGKILLDDKKLYVAGDTSTSGLSAIKVGMGSPVSQEYQILEEGQITEWDINGSPVYKKIFLRYLPNGSFVGEL
jgi:hypothetical protein